MLLRAGQVDCDHRLVTLITLLLQDDASEQDAAKAEAQENFIRGMLTNHSQLPLSEIHNKLTMFSTVKTIYETASLASPLLLSCFSVCMDYML